MKELFTASLSRKFLWDAQVWEVHQAERGSEDIRHLPAVPREHRSGGRSAV